jgi:curved DNA-binding protein CbpA
MHRPPTHYDTLDVSAAATAEDIRDAYRALCLRHHPDKNPDDPDADDTMADINAAYEVLSDPARRREYDLTLQELSGDEEEKPSAQSAHPHKAPPAPLDDEAYQRAVNREFLTRVTHITIGVIVFAAIVIYSIVDCLRDTYCHAHGHFHRFWFFF